MIVLGMKEQKTAATKNSDVMIMIALANESIDQGTKSQILIAPWRNQPLLCHLQQ